MKSHNALLIAFLLALVSTGCAGTSGAVGERPQAQAQSPVAAHPFGRAGFEVEVVDGRLWVLSPGQKKSEKHITLVGAGPAGMTIKALDNETALRYLAAKDGFEVEVSDGRLWVLAPGQKKSEKHVTFVGAGPLGTTLKALNNETALRYLAAKAGFEVEIAEGRLWVLSPGQKKSEKHVTFVGAGPHGMTVKALDSETALRYLAAKDGFEVEIEDGRLWVLAPGQKKSEKHVTFVGVGPRGMTVKGADERTVRAYLAARS